VQIKMPSLALQSEGAGFGRSKKKIETLKQNLATLEKIVQSLVEKK